ncbi:MAG: leucine-rich repeat domain-containing protein [Candidatus Andersenbacteria bacterium]|nr:leucine-rich repeat domain-containing protein [bacterium]MDZ4225473.1 leucine-rich repeat domain-containing protein [Candidatus Andersenbacteria bacterium]
MNIKLIISVTILLLIAVGVLVFFSFFFNTRTTDTGQADSPTPAASAKTDLSSFEPPRCPGDQIFYSLGPALREPEKVCHFSPSSAPDLLLQSLDKFTNMKILILSQQNLSSVPATIFGLPNLTVLDLSNNQLTALPAELNKIDSLEMVIIRNNPISPEELKTMNTTFPNKIIISQ